MKITLSLNDKRELIMNICSDRKHKLIDTDQSWLLAHDVNQSEEYGRMTSVVSNALYSYHHALIENSSLFGDDYKLIVECQI